MCGRLTLQTPADQLVQMLLPFTADPELADFQPRYNIAPTQMVFGIASTEPGRNQLGQYRWGLVPGWADDLRIGNKMINARRETLQELRSFKGPLNRKRCLIVADGYYEWQRLTDKVKHTYWIRPNDGGLFFLAGLFEHNTRATGSLVSSCTIITTAANSAMSEIHNRMPMPLPVSKAQQWLEPTVTGEMAYELLEAADDSIFSLRPVTSYVNNTRNQGPECIAPA